MSAAVAIPRITVCPPGPARPELTTEFFDKGHRVTGRAPVSAEFDGSDFSSPGIAFEDYSRMYTQQRKQSGERRLPTPSWALNPTQLRSLLVFYIERRAQLLNRQPGTEQERLERASQNLANKSNHIEAILRNLCGEYIALNKSGENPARLKKLKAEIGNYDTQLRLNRNVAAIVLQVVYLYYRMSLDSVGVATEVGLKPPHVRIILLRLHEAWARMNVWRGPRLRINVLGDWKPPAKDKPAPKVRRVRKSKIDLNVAVQMRDAGKTYPEIGIFFGVRDNTVREALQKAGLWKPYVPTPKPAHIRTRKIDIVIAVKMRDAGKTYQEIATLFGAQECSVIWALKNAGLWKPPAPRFKIDVDLFTRLFHAGKTTTEIGDALGITTQMVRYYLRRLRLLRLKPKVDIEVAARMFAAGATYSAIAKALNLPIRKNERVPGMTVARALKRHGLWKPRRKKIAVDFELIARLFDEGNTQNEMAKSLGIPRHIVRLRLKRLGLWRGQGRGRRPNYSKVDRALAAKMFADGKSYGQIATFFAVHKNSITYALKKHGCWQPRRHSRVK